MSHFGENKHKCLLPVKEAHKIIFRVYTNLYYYLFVFLLTT